MIMVTITIMSLINLFYILCPTHLTHPPLLTQGVKPDWTWEQTMRAIIGKPMYRALKTLAERKQAFHDYVDDLRKKEEVIIIIIISYIMFSHKTCFIYLFFALFSFNGLK